MTDDVGEGASSLGNGSITSLIPGVLDEDRVAQQKVLERYWDKLLRVARQRIHASKRRVQDEEDIVLSAFHSFFAAANAGRFPNLSDRHELWGLLLTIAVRKSRQYRRYLSARKRGGLAARGESDIARRMGGLSAILSKDPTPEMLVITAETLGLLIRQLPDERLQQIAHLKLEGNTSAEIARSLGCSVRTIERKLERITLQWQQEAARL